MALQQVLGHRENGDTQYLCLWANHKVSLADERKLDDQDPEVKAYRFPEVPYYKRCPVYLGDVTCTMSDGLEVYPSGAVVAPGASVAVRMPASQQKLLRDGPRIEVRQAGTLQRSSKDRCYEIRGLHPDLVQLLDANALVVFHNLNLVAQ